MTTDDNNKNDLPPQIRPPGNLLDAALSHLPAEQQKALMQKALEKKLELDAKAVEADQLHSSSSVDMAQTVQQLKAIEQSTKSDYTIRANYKTASGQTNVEIKKANNNVIIIVAIVVAVIALLFLSR